MGALRPGAAVVGVECYFEDVRFAGIYGCRMGLDVLLGVVPSLVPLVVVVVVVDMMGSEVAIFANRFLAKREGKCMEMREVPLPVRYLPVNYIATVRKRHVFMDYQSAIPQVVDAAAGHG